MLAPMKTRLLATSLVLFSCATFSGEARVTQPQPGLEEAKPRPILPPSEADRLRGEGAMEEARRLVGAQADILWSRWLGEEPADPERPAWLFERETLEAVERLRAHAGDPLGAKAYGRLERFLLGEALAEALAEEEAAVRGRARDLFASLAGALAREGDAEARRARGREALQAGGPLAEAVAAKRRRLSLVADEWGRGDELELLGALRGTTPEEAAELASTLLDRTAALWREAFTTAALRELGQPLENLAWVDLPRVFQSAGLDVRLRARSPSEALARTPALAEEGWESRATLAVHRDEGRGREPRPLCIPGGLKVRLSIPPQGGGSHRALFREVGCAIFASQGGEALAWVDEPVMSAFASLFEGIAEEPGWLRQVGELTEAEARLRSAVSALRRLQRLRAQAAGILFEVESHRGRLEGEALDRAFRRNMERAFLFPVEPGWGLLEDPDLLGSVDTLRGEVLAAALQRDLGPGWWDRPASRDRLRSLSAAGAAGQRELMEVLGMAGWEVEALASQIEGSLRGVFIGEGTPPPAPTRPAAPGP